MNFVHPPLVPIFEKLDLIQLDSLIPLFFNLSWRTSVQMMQMLEKLKSPISLRGEDRGKQPTTKNRRRHLSVSGRHIEAQCLHTPVVMRCSITTVSILINYKILWFVVAIVVHRGKTKTAVNVLDLHLLQGEESVVTRLAPPPAMLASPQGQATAMNFNENAEGDGDPKTGNTCNALSGKTGQSSIPMSL